MTLFGKTFSNLFGNQAEPQPEAPIPDIKTELEQAWSQVQSLADEQLRSESTETDVTRPEDRFSEEHKAAQRELWDEILALHDRLGTELTESSLPRLRQVALGHAFAVEEPSDLSLEGRIDYFVLKDLFRRCAERAWDRLGQLMEPAGEGWPIPPDLSYHRAPESVAEMVDRRQQDLKEEFVSASLQKQADLTLGEVQVWGPTYPASGSWLWQQTALVSVGAGLQLQLFTAALELWLWRSPNLDAALSAQIEKELVAAKELLHRGVLTLEDAENVANRSRQVCTNILPALVWNYLEPQLNWDGGTPKLTTLTNEVSTIDPVCGMALTSERIAARAIVDDTTYHFCGESCRDRFQANPKKYLTEAT